MGSPFVCSLNLEVRVENNSESFSGLSRSLVRMLIEPVRFPALTAEENDLPCFGKFL